MAQAEHVDMCLHQQCEATPASWFCCSQQPASWHCAIGSGPNLGGGRGWLLRAELTVQSRGAQVPVMVLAKYLELQDGSLQILAMEQKAPIALRLLKGREKDTQLHCKICFAISVFNHLGGFWLFQLHEHP